jgi:hypothetical protein
MTRGASVDEKTFKNMKLLSMEDVTVQRAGLSKEFYNHDNDVFDCEQ